ncbi:MAG: hypothetical protein WCJ09_16420 [Planctomycetota bacterium]
MINRVRSAIAGVGLLLIIGCADPVNVANFDRIQTGMTVKEVEEIMGGSRPESYETLKTWRGSKSHTITIEIDDRGLVVNKTRDGF